MVKISGKKIVFIIAPNNFRDEEYFQPKVILQAQGAKICTAAKGDPEEVTGTRGGKARTDTKFSEVISENFDAVVFVGGAGAKVYLRDKDIHSIAKEFYSKGKVIAAICIAPSILANAGLLKERKATSFSDQQKTIEKKGGIWIDENVVVDGQIVTANGPEAAFAFGEKIAEVLNST